MARKILLDAHAHGNWDAFVEFIERRFRDEFSPRLVTVEHLNATMTAHMKRSLPAKTTREKLFAELKRVRLIDYRADPQVDDADALIAIRGTILQFVADSAIDTLLAEAQKPTPASVHGEGGDEA